jgi:acyl-CoA reductase-like NAD-dependent aldehyde dehydrogenase
MATQLFIDGQWTDSTGTTAIDTIDPDTGLVIDQVPTASGADVDAAVAAARAALTDPAWAALLPVQRAGLLFRLAALMEERHEELAQLETRDQGQPIGISRMVSVGGAAEHVRYYAGWVTKIQGSTNPVSFPETLHYTRREPVGVTALITPWNFPLMILAWKLAPALAAGNTVVIKPSEVTPLTSLRLVELCAEAGFPPGEAVQVILARLLPLIVLAALLVLRRRWRLFAPCLLLLGYVTLLHALTHAEVRLSEPLVHRILRIVLSQALCTICLLAEARASAGNGLVH